MSYTITLSSAARRHLREIVAWLVETEQVRTAANFVDAFEELQMHLRIMPTRYAPFRSNPAYRLASVLWYKVIYEVDETTNSVGIIAIRHERSDLMSFFKTL